MVRHRPHSGLDTPYHALLGSRGLLENDMRVTLSDMTEPPTNSETLPDFLGESEVVPPGLSDVAQLRREQIMDAAEAIIAQEGIHRLSLKRIEEKVGKMSRGQLTYYFPNKESILLAVHDRMLRRMITAMLRGGGPKPMTKQAWECAQHALALQLGPGEPPAEAKDLFSLLYTFLAQMGHREDYRNRLSETYRGWREYVAKDIVASVPEPRPVSPTIAASLFQALLHGLTMQLMVDPAAFDREEMLAACVRFLAPMFQQAGVPESQVPEFQKKNGQ